MGQFKDFTGQRFGKLVAIRRVNAKGRHWWFRCDCGMGKMVLPGNAYSGATTNCGCVKRTVAAEPFPIRVVTSLPKTYEVLRLIKRYRNMMRRCYSEDHPSYRNWGKRGIGVCIEWRNSFDAFAKWALANGFKPELTLDRKDNYQGYSPTNCRFVTMRENQRNKRVHQDARGGLPA